MATRHVWYSPVVIGVPRLWVGASSLRSLPELPALAFLFVRVLLPGRRACAGRPGHSDEGDCVSVLPEDAVRGRNTSWAPAVPGRASRVSSGFRVAPLSTKGKSPFNRHFPGKKYIPLVDDLRFEDGEELIRQIESLGHGPNKDPRSHTHGQKWDHGCSLQTPEDASEVWGLVWWASKDFLFTFFY